MGTTEQLQAAGLDSWRAQDGGIARTYETTGWPVTLLLVNAIGFAAETAFHHPDLEVSYDSVTVKLSTHSAKGITDKDFLMAAKLEEVVAWQPGKDGGALTGPPSGSAYVKYDG